MTALAIRANSDGLTQTAILGLAAVTTALGAASLGVPLLGLGGRLADRVGASYRLVLGDAARQRTRSGATVAALVAVTMIPALLLTSTAADEARFDAITSPDPAAILRGPYLNGLQLPVTDTAVQHAIDLLPVDPVTRIDIAALYRPDEANGRHVRAVVLDEVGGPSSTRAWTVTTSACNLRGGRCGRRG